MGFNHKHYVPCLRWKQGEYQAILRLFDNTKAFITPLIEVPEIGYDFETQKANKTIDDHLEPFVKRVMKKWGTKPCFVDISLVNPNERLSGDRHPLKFIFDELRDNKCRAIPVTSLNRDKAFRTVIKRITSTDNHGLSIRLNIEEATKPELNKSIDTILRSNDLKANQCDLVLDLGAPNFEPVDSFAKLCVVIIKRIPKIDQWRSFIICGTSFPKSMGSIKRGTTIKHRFEWLLYKSIVKILSTDNVRLPTFGDYGINHPDVLPRDMRFVTPSATVRYTTQDSWLIVKGINVRKNGFEQYRDLCRNVISSSHYLGEDFSSGDKYIADCGKGQESTGNLTTWRWVGTNHHIEKVVDDIASFFESLGNP